MIFMILLDNLYATLFLKLKNVESGKNPSIIGGNPIIVNNGKFRAGNKFRIRYFTI